MNKLLWIGGDDGLKIAVFQVCVFAATSDWMIHCVSDRHGRSEFCPLSWSRAVLDHRTTGVVIRCFAYPALALSGLQSLVMTKECRAWEKKRGLQNENKKCRVNFEAKWNGSDCAPFGLAQRGAAPLDSPPSPVAGLQEEKPLLQPCPKGAGTPSASRVRFAGTLARSTRYARGCGLRFRP